MAVSFLITKTAFRTRPRFSLGGRVSAVWRPRVAVGNLVLLAATVLLFLLSIGVGDYPLSPGEVARVLLGGGSSLERTIVLDWRLPRAAVGLAAGAALALSGAITQSIARNPLASPDVLGITAGASVAAVTVLVVGGSAVGGAAAALGLPVAAFLGALAAGVVIWLLGTRRGMDPFRLVITGIILSALLMAVQQWLMIKANLNDAAAAQTWLAGSLGQASYSRLIPLVIVLVAALPALVWVAFHLSALVLGEEAAAGLGVPVRRADRAMLLLAVALSAVAVSAAGPIGFVAFVAPQLARLLAGLSTPPLVGSLLVGALLVVGGDLAARSLLPNELPVGLLTSVIGGVFLIFLLVRTNRKATL